MKKEEENSHNDTENHSLYTNKHHVHILVPKCKRRKRWNPKVSSKNRKEKGQMRRATNFENLIKKSLIRLCC